VSGIADGCVQAGCALVGGETAEHGGNHDSGLYDYDLAGFCVGVVDKPKLVGKTAKIGDVIIGLASSGVHSNGFSLVRKVFGDADTDTALLETLLTPTRIYVKPILSLIERVAVKGIANITGGGFYENIPRCLPDGLTARIAKDSYTVPEIFVQIAEVGNIPEQDMYGTFNMGVGMVVVVSPEVADAAIAALAESDVTAWRIGDVGHDALGVPVSIV
jgi:phosphoribosylformylglycinamidine cyclo-ligase